jgi:hypothetical protein
MLLLLQTFQATGILWKLLETALLRVNGYARRLRLVYERDKVFDRLCSGESKTIFEYNFTLVVYLLAAFLLLFEVRET